jgi:hypothetical protein
MQKKKELTPHTYVKGTIDLYTLHQLDPIRVFISLFSKGRS